MILPRPPAAGCAGGNGVASKQGKEPAYRPVSARFDLLGLGHRQYSEQSPHLLVADGQPTSKRTTRRRLFHPEEASPAGSLAMGIGPEVMLLPGML